MWHQSRFLMTHNSAFIEMSTLIKHLGWEIFKCPRPSVSPSVRLSVTFSFRTVTKKRCRYVYHVMGVCCIVFDIDGMLFECFMIFLNIETKYIQKKSRGGGKFLFI